MDPRRVAAPLDRESMARQTRTIEPMLGRVREHTGADKSAVDAAQVADQRAPPSLRVVGPSQILALQRTAGNTRVTRLLARYAEVEPEVEVEPEIEVSPERLGDTHEGHRSRRTEF